MNKKFSVSRLSVVVYWAIIIAMTVLFFTNDFGLVDIHKTSIIVAVGIDLEDDEVQVTAQLAVPQPSQSGDNVQYIEVQGSGITIADALNEINAKTGFYPKLLFCKLILVGESCRNENLFKVLSCFYRKNYSELTPLVAMCKGKASEMLSLPAAVSPETSTAMQRALADELKKSANVSSVNLKDIAYSHYSKSEACYMPYIEANVQGTSESGGNGDNVGGESGGQGGQGSQGGSGSSGGSGGGGEEGQSGSSGGEQGGEGRQMEFTARKTAAFSRGEFVGILDEQQSFALDIMQDGIRLAVIPFDSGGVHYTLGLKNTKADVKLKVNKGVPELTLKFGAKAQIQGKATVLRPESIINDDVIRPEVLKSAEEEIKLRLEQLIKTCAEGDCDLLGAKELLYKYNAKYFEAFNKDLLTRMKVKYDIKIVSVN